MPYPTRGPERATTDRRPHAGERRVEVIRWDEARDMTVRRAAHVIGVRMRQHESDERSAPSRDVGQHDGSRRRRRHATLARHRREPSAMRRTHRDRIALPDVDHVQLGETAAGGVRRRPRPKRRARRADDERAPAAPAHARDDDGDRQQRPRAPPRMTVGDTASNRPEPRRPRARWRRRRPAADAPHLPRAPRATEWARARDREKASAAQAR